MYLLRRAAVRSFSSQTAALISSPRTIATKTPSTLRAQQWRVSALQRRFASDDASPAKTESSSAEHEAKQEVEKSEDAPATVAETAQNVAQSIKESASSTVEAIKETVTPTTETVEETKAQVNDASRSAAAQLLGKSANEADVGVFGQPKPSKILYVGNLFFEVKAEELEREFSKYGRVANCRIATDPRGLSKGFAYVEFEDADQAADAIEALDQSAFKGRRMAVQYHVRRDPGARNETRGPRKDNNPPHKTLFIGNMSFQMTDKDLNEVFKNVKNVLDVRVAIDRRSGQPRGFAHADFLDVESAVAAKEALQGKSIFGRQLRIDFGKDQVRTERPQYQRTERPRREY